MKRRIKLWIFTLLILGMFSAKGNCLTPDDRYHSYSEISNDFSELANNNSDLASIVNLGNSFEGRKIFALKITKGDEEKPKILFTGGVHAREWLGVETTRLIAKYILADYDKDSEVKKLLDNAEVWIVPAANPDGFEYDRSTGSAPGWRKNRRPVDVNNDGSIDGIGVDLNRNFDFHWDPPLTASTNPSSDIFRGPSAASEPEVKILQALLDQGFSAFIDFHSFSQLIIYPWGYSSSAAPDVGDFENMGQEMNQKIFGVNNKSYTVGQIPHVLYPVSGDNVDYAYGKLKTYAFCIELPPAGGGGAGGFHPPANFIIPTAKENYEAVKYLVASMIKEPKNPKESPQPKKPGNPNEPEIINIIIKPEGSENTKE